MSPIVIARTRLFSELPGVITDFQKGLTLEDRTKMTPLRIITELGTNYYGIHKRAQTKPSSLADLKQIVHITLKLTKENYIVQVIGDSRPFTQEGTTRGYKFLDLVLETNAYVLYGYTGSSSRTGSKCVNALTSAYLKDHGLLPKAIGSVVGYQTLSCLRGKNSPEPDLSHYVVVYGDNETSPRDGTHFGDDVPTSDYLADRFVLLEGGCQSFVQACNALAMEKPICSLVGIRDETSRSYFSAAEFLHFLDTGLGKVAEEERTPAYLHLLKATYLRDRSLADPKKRDYREKIASFEKAWNYFVENRLDKNLYLLKTHGL